MFDDSPELEAKAVFEWMCREYPGSYQEGQLRTFQRRVRQWRALMGLPAIKKSSHQLRFPAFKKRSNRLENR